METFEKRALKKLSTVEAFDSIIAEFKEELETAHIKEKNSKNFEAKKKETKLVLEVKPLQIKYNNLKQQWWNITNKLLTIFVYSFFAILALLKTNNEIKKSHACEEDGAHLRISFWQIY